MRKLPAALISIVILFQACTSNNVTEDNSLKRFFDSAGVKSGCFALYDNGQGSFTIYNLRRYRDSAYPPGATFNILQSLIALQTGTVANETKQLREAFQRNQGDSTFLSLTEKLGKDTLKRWVDSLHYGNQDLNGPLDSCWLNGHLLVPADQQLGLIKKLYFKQLPFFGRPQEIVRGMMRTESNTNYQLVYKTALVPYKGHVLNWALGWVEENKHPYFFALDLDMPDQNTNDGEIGIQIVKRILPAMGFFEGKK